jgi:hypothetical protein
MNVQTVFRRDTRRSGGRTVLLYGSRVVELHWPFYKTGSCSLTALQSSVRDDRAGEKQRVTPREAQCYSRRTLDKRWEQTSTEHEATSTHRHKAMLCLCSWTPDSMLNIQPSSNPATMLVPCILPG